MKRPLSSLPLQALRSRLVEAGTSTTEYLIALAAGVALLIAPVDGQPLIVYVLRAIANAFANLSHFLSLPA